MEKNWRMIRCSPGPVPQAGLGAQAKAPGGRMSFVQRIKCLERPVS